MNKKWEAFKNWWEKLGASMDQGDNVFDAQESMSCFENMFTEQKPLQSVKPWKPGNPCVIVYRNGKTNCPKFSESSVCPNTDCKYRVYHERYLTAKEKYETEKAKWNQMIAERADAGKELVSR